MNSRQSFAQQLRSMADDRLGQLYARNEQMLTEAKQRGDCAMVAVLHFDAAQITNELLARLPRKS